MPTTPSPPSPDANPQPTGEAPNAAAPPQPSVAIEADPEIDLFCPGCGYDLRALQGDACPECGAGIDLDQLRATGIPWVLGVGLFGKAWGFARTCLSVTFRPRRFCREVAKPVSLNDARWFRRVVVTLVWVSAVVTARAVFWSYEVWDESEDFSEFVEEELLLQMGWVSAIFAACGLLFVIGWTGLHLYWLHPRGLAVERQDRAVALGHYACAPLAWLPIVALVSIAGIGMEWAGYEYDFLGLRTAGQVVWGLSALLAVACIGLFWLNAWVFAGRAAHRGAMGQLGLAAALPLLWAGWLLLTLAALPAAAGFVSLVIWSW